MRVLVIEDERELAEHIADGLRDAGWAVDVAFDGASGLEKATFNSYDVVVLDRDLPALHGDDVCRAMHEGGSVSRILMLTASGDLDERIAGLMLGADDYLSKPFAFGELVARVTALARRSAAPGPPTLRGAGITVDRVTRRVHRGGAEVVLTRREYAVLCVLLEHPGRVVSAEELLERAWDENADPFTSAVRITMLRLRRKLGDPPPIETVIGAGYRVID